MLTAKKDSLFILPVCYHPTTVLSIDDDTDFLKILSASVSDKLSLLCFNEPEKAIEYTKNQHHFYPFIERCLITDNDTTTFQISAIRDEIYNENRFKEIAITVTDYDMPHKNGIDLIKTMTFQPEVSQFAHIILTGKISTEFKEKLVGLGLASDYIGKDDPQFIHKLLDQVETRLSRVFQWYSYMPARLLSRNKNEKTTVLFDGDFAELFNGYIKDHQICEFYLFDKQGSYLFLDQNATPSWLFIRNDVGVQNTIKLAEQFGAPQSIIDDLRSKKFILSLYELSDFEKRKNIEWDKYVLPATVFNPRGDFLNFFSDLMPESAEGKKIPPSYYYAFSNEFPENDIDKNKILSYEQFLQN